ncbi:MAG: alpha/beta hydrolase [Myxococcales bacterium]|nr:alpha/beta hydrolase [Myxococcales bacterium]
MAVASGVGVLAAGIGCAGASSDGPAVNSGANASTRGGAGTFVETRDGARLFHLDWGHGKPVVFLHAWALNADLWEYQMTELADRGLRAIAYDRRGHGRSSDPGRGYDFDRLADDLATVLDTLDLHEVTLVGHSMGSGEIARYLTRHGGRRIARTVLVSAITPLVARRPDYPQGTDPRAYEAIIAALKADRPAALTGGVGLFTGSRTVSPAMTQWLADQFLRSSASAVIGCMRAIAAADFRADLRAFTMPTLIVHGDADLLNPIDLTGRPTASAIPGSRLEIYAGGPHGLPLTDKERFTQELFAFTRR